MYEAAHSVATASPQAPRHAAPEQEVTAVVPPQPRTIRDSGLERPLVLGLVAKAVQQAGRAYLSLLAGKLRLSIGVLREAIDLLMADQIVEIAARGETEIDVQYRLTEAGKAYAAECLAHCRYVGPAPVTLDAFRAVLAQGAERYAQSERIGSAHLNAVFAEDGVEAGVREQLGAALHAGRPWLLHGASGSGKSALAGKLARLLPGVIAVPHAILIDGQIVQFYDPLLHLAPLPAQARLHEERRNCDARWLVCQRPLVQVGAELTREMLDLRYDAENHIYQAPPHLQASGGMFVVDDLGRQRIPAAELLNRFIGPLDYGQDHLSMQGGHTETLPFHVAMVFITNLAPQALLDEPLLRRIAYKIHLGALSEASYSALLRHQCSALRIGFDEDALAYLLKRLHGASGRPLLASYPRELMSRVCDFAGFEGRAPRLTVAALEQAWRSMFACSAVSATPVAAPAQGAVVLGEIV